MSSRFFIACFMPSSPPKPCAHVGCGVLVRDGSSRCALHKRVEARLLDARRGSAASRGYGYKWQQASKGFLKQNPLCVRHKARGAIEPATVVDHIVPHKGDMSLFWQRSNWQALCKQCHDLKTAVEDGGFGRGPMGRGG